MNRYEIGRRLGEGSFGSVYLATKKSTGEKRAIKRMKGSFSWDKVVELRELQSILRLPAHANIVQLHEIIREKDDIVLFVFEYMPSGTLQDLLQHTNGPLPDTEIRCLVQQLLMGLKHMHNHGTFHRDLKPENIILDGRVCKIADFSLARPIDEDGPCTSYVSTRWYRAPEILLNSRAYSSPVDMFAMACVTAELYSLKPLFPGFDEVDQLRHIFAKLGTPRMHLWQDGTNLLNIFPIQNWPEPQLPPRTILENSLRHKKSVHQNFDDTVLDFLLVLLALDPSKRMTAQEALQHNYFMGIDAVALNAAHARDKTPATQQLPAATAALPAASKNSDASSFSSHTTPASSKQLSKTNQMKHLVTVSPPPEHVLLQRSRAPAVKPTQNKRPANNNSPFLSPASISNPYIKKNSNKRRA